MDGYVFFISSPGSDRVWGVKQTVMSRRRLEKGQRIQLEIDARKLPKKVISSLVVFKSLHNFSISHERISRFREGVI